MPGRNLEAVIAATREVGDMAMARWRGEGQAIDVWHKSHDNPVSDVDLAVDARLKAVLGAMVPEAGWLSEETADNDARLSRRAMWCVDPIDGTRDFIRGRPGWAVSVALVVDGAPELGVLYAPALDELWVAQRGQGAQLNGEALRASSRTSFDGARVPADSLPKIDRDLVMVTKPNSIALRMALVADDRADLVATLRWGFEWDVAAAALIATEAGATVTDAFGAPLVFNTPRAQAFGVIACAPGIHRAVVDRLHDRAVALTSAG
ncbi:3'(2'),5'-bisphosphate nucleotidase CysQ [Sphingopyxis sp. GW247-27LB]|uniref:inositol monophosphatase family protein n=1 Tax=Sphingopyxis sp. GW247-27LB TaxID=2012632 RepID=UPI000BA67F21|nr:3'(2'),5'-bisphosphate nucleotidase CysQ [Sphingopyxis sp. GW247-27LB]PAL21320.1 3'(2'),5'-bisphosphate nucleotidase CysQ [Sphingopyxis sp. GW247-27LB]